MKTIYILNGVAPSTKRMIDEFLWDLPVTKRGKKSYRSTRDTITFVRSADAIVFRLKFGL